jgi:hypothetical protein
MFRHSAVKARRPARFRPSLENLEDRLVPSTASDIPYATHPGPAQLALNFDGNPRTDGGPEHDYVVAAYDDGSAGRDQNIQDTLFRTSEIYAPFDVEVFRAKGANDYLNGSDGTGPTTIFVGSDFGANSFGAGVTPGQYADYPVEEHDHTDHIRNSDPFDLAYVDPFNVTDANGNDLGPTGYAKAIAHEAGHTFGLAHVRTDGVDYSSDGQTQPASKSTTPDVMTYDNLTTLGYFSTDYLPLCGWNQGSSGPEYQPDSEYPVYDDNGTHIAATTQDSFLSLAQVLGLRDEGNQFHVVDLGAIDWQQAGSYVHPTSDDMDAKDSIITQQGMITRLGDYDVIRWTAPRNETINVNLTGQGGLSPLLMTYDGQGQIQWQNSGTSTPANSSDLIKYDKGANLIYIQDSLGGRGSLQVGGAPAGTLSVAGGKSYYFVIGAQDADSTGGYQLTINQLPVWASLNGTTLAIDGSRLVPRKTEVLTIETSVQGKLQVTLNGVLAQFPSGQVKAIDVHALGANNTINITPGAHSFADLSSLPTSITIDGSVRAAVFIDDGYDVAATTYTVSNVGVTRAAQNEFMVAINYGRLANLTINTGSAADTVDVEGTPGPTRVVGGGGADTFSVGETNHSLDGIAGLLTLDGGTGGATLTVNDEAHPNGIAPSPYTVTSSGVYRKDLELTWSWVNWQLEPTWVTTGVSYANMSRLTLDTSDQAANVVNVASTSVWTDIYAGSGTSQINLTPWSHNLDNIGAFLDVFGKGNVALAVNDQANLYGQLSGVASSYLVGDDFRRTVQHPYQPGTSTTEMQFFGLKSLTVNTSTSSPNQVTVDTLTQTTINSGAADAITVDSNALSGGHVTVNAHGGTLHLDDHVLQNDDEDGYTAVYTVVYTISDQGVSRRMHTHSLQIIDTSDDPNYKGPKRIIKDFWSGASTVSYTQVTGITLDGPAVDSYYTVASTKAGAPVTINSQTGDKPWILGDPERPTWNRFQVGTTGSVKSIRSALTLNGASSADTLLLDDSATSTQDKVTVSPTQVGTAALDKFFASGGGLSYSNLGEMTLKLSNAFDDAVNLTPSPETAFEVLGSLTAFQAGHGMRLNFLGAVNPHNTPTSPASGQWTFDNGQAVTYGVTLADVTAQLAFQYGGITYNAATNLYEQTVTLTNTGGKPIIGPLSLVLDNLTFGVSLTNRTGFTVNTNPAHSPYLDVVLANGTLAAGQSATVTLEFASPTANITYIARALAGTGSR